ncbi:hypothetical protein [Fulvivirga lutea]|uniref:Uncharacterized protein n=1 Tax=Fulvivirga lutea TaxID=2810512 RepID=A0A975A0P0_9BACT|nr:hypothetical protein [Fulvivirga lutea]QSE96657.1 hypothetical protein JR347_13780 [Fulvivirga lutea]
MNRLIKALWFTTLVSASAFLLFVYAGFREDQLIFVNNELEGLDRETFFFLALTIITVSNFTFYILSWRLRKQDNRMAEFIKGWLMGLASALNFFLIVVLSFLQIFNGGENFNYQSIGYLIFVSLGAVIICAMTLPIFLVKEKISS